MSDDAHMPFSSEAATVWKQWNEATTIPRSESRERQKEAYQVPAGLAYGWMRPMACFERWYNVTSGTWVRGIMYSRHVLEAHYHLMETYLHAVGNLYPGSVTALQQPRASACTDLTCAAQMVISLEERVYSIEDAFTSVDDRHLQKITDQAVAELTQRLEHVESKFAALNVRAEPHQQSATPGDLAARLERLEGMLERLLTAMEQSETPASSHPDCATEVHMLPHKHSDQTS